MPDTVTPQVRSRMMASIRGWSTKPEMRVRRYLHAAGLRFRVNDRRLPGSPDLVFGAARVALFVHGCFWHRHADCRFCTTPGTRSEFWAAKFAANVARDAEDQARLSTLGWHVMTVWECDTGSPLTLDELFWRIRAHEDSDRPVK